MISWIFYIELIGHSFIASILVIHGLDNHYVINRVGDKAKLYGWLAVQYTMVAVPLGMLFAIYLKGYKSNRRIFHNYLNKPIVRSFSHGDSYIKIPLLFLSIICIFSVTYTFIMLREIPFIAILSGKDSSVLDSLRIEASREFLGNIYVRNILAIGITPILSYISFSYWRLTRKKSDRLWFLLMLMSSIFILTYNLEKAPVIFYLIGFVFLIVLTDGGVKRSSLIAFGFLCLIILTLFYYSIMGNFDAFSFVHYNTGIVGRILLSQSAGTYMAFEHFPNTHEFIGFKATSDIINNFFGVQGSETAARILMTIFNPTGVEAGTAGVMNSLFIAEAWANFGLIGILIAPLYVGFIIQVLFIHFLKFDKTPLMLGLFAFLSYKMPVTGGLTGFFYNPGLMIVFLIFVLMYVAGVLLRMMSSRNFVDNHT
jgi:oligosaccharide repeat unit polymerase